MSKKQPGKKPDPKRGEKQRRAIRNRPTNPRPAEANQQEQEPGIEEGDGSRPGKPGSQP